MVYRPQPVLSAIEVLESGPEPSNFAEDALARMVILYQAWGKPEKAAECQARVDAFGPDDTGAR